MKKVATVREYFAAVPARQRAALQKVRKAISTEYISYGMPMFKYRGRRLVAIAAFQNHCSMFPMSKAVIAAHRDALGERDTSKGTIRFPPEKPLSDALVKKIVKARIKENAARWPSG